MKGLLIKDLKLTLLNARMFVIIIAITIFMLTQTGSSAESAASFAVSYITIIFGMFVLSTISYDDFEHGLSFLFTLPITRRLYTAEKYVFGLLSSLAGWLLSLILWSILTLLGGNNIPADFWMVNLSTYLILIFILSVSIPVQLKFGGDNGKIVIFIVIGACFALGMAGVRILKKLEFDPKKLLDPLMQSSPGVLIALGITFIILAMFISYQISCKIVEKKQL